jgi:hypothetical protein
MSSPVMYGVKLTEIQTAGMDSALFQRGQHSLSARKPIREPEDPRFALLPTHNKAFSEKLGEISFVGVGTVHPVDGHGVGAAREIKRRLRAQWRRDVLFYQFGLGCVQGYSRAQIAHFNAERRAGK